MKAREAEMGVGVAVAAGAGVAAGAEARTEARVLILAKAEAGRRRKQAQDMFLGVLLGRYPALLHQAANQKIIWMWMYQHNVVSIYILLSLFFNFLLFPPTQFT